MQNKDIEKGFYYHYKHDPAGEVNNYAYEVLNIGHHTEMPHGEDGGVDQSLMVVYRPLYEAFVYKAGKHWDVRPYDMFIEQVTKDGAKMNRFTKIIDQKVIRKLEEIRDRMY